MTAAAPTPRDLLVESRTLIARPETWPHGAALRGADGEPVSVEHKDAISWCATGALNCALYRHADSLEVPPPLQRACERAGKILTDTVRVLKHTGPDGRACETMKRFRLGETYAELKAAALSERDLFDDAAASAGEGGDTGSLDCLCTD